MEESPFLHEKGTFLGVFFKGYMQVLQTKGALLGALIGLYARSSRKRHPQVPS